MAVVERAGEMNRQSVRAFRLHSRDTGIVDRQADRAEVDRCEVIQLGRSETTSIVYYYVG